MRPRGLLVVASPVMPCACLLAREPRAADGTPPRLLGQEVRAPWRRRSQPPVSRPVLEVRRPGGIHGVGVALHLAMARRFHGLPHADDLRTAERIAEPPGVPRLRGEGARGDPAPGVGRGAPSGPPRASSPHAVVECGERLAPKHIAGIVRPTPQEGVEGLAARGRGPPRGSRTEGGDRGGEGLQTRPARQDLPRGRLVVGPLRRAPARPEEVEALRDGGADGRRRRQPDAPCDAHGVAPRPDRVCEALPRMGGAADGLGPPHVRAVVDSALPAAAGPASVESSPHPMTDRRREAALWREARGGPNQGAAVENAAATPWRQSPSVHGEVRVAPRKPAVSANPLDVPVQEPGGGALRPQDLATLVEGLRASTRGPTPVGVRRRRGLGPRLPRVQRDRWPCPVGPGRARQRALLAVVRGKRPPSPGR
jgi:hypothetical protein